LTGGEKADSEQALPLLNGQHAGAVVADKGYDADYIVDAVEAMGSAAVIPPRSNRRNARRYDVHLYTGRNLIERMFGKLKQFRRVATRYDKLASSFMAFIMVAAISIWLR